MVGLEYRGQRLGVGGRSAGGGGGQSGRSHELGLGVAPGKGGATGEG